MNNLQSVALCMLIHPVMAHATAQIPDKIVIDGESQILFSEPLRHILGQAGASNILTPYSRGSSRSSASWRGYVAHWEIQSDILFLSEVRLNPCGTVQKNAPLEELFPEQTIPVHAVWYTGTLLIPKGKRLQYVHIGYESKYERYLTIFIENGKVIRREESTDRPK